MQGSVKSLTRGGINIEIDAGLGHLHYFIQPIIQRFRVLSQQGSPFRMRDETLCDKVVCKKHVFLNQSIRIANGVRHCHQRCLSIRVELKGEFDTMQRKRSAIEAKLSPRDGDTVHETNIRCNLVNCVAARWTPTLGPQVVIQLALRFTGGNFPVDNILGGGVIETRT
jgi:hypothetical protein